jgi:hypothetical protein
VRIGGLAQGALARCRWRQALLQGDDLVGHAHVGAEDMQDQPFGQEGQRLGRHLRRIVAGGITRLVDFLNEGRMCLRWGFELE